MALTTCALQHGLADGGAQCSVGWCVGQQHFCGGHAPRLVRQATKCQPGTAHTAIRRVDDGRNRNRGEGVRGPVAHLAVDLHARRRWRQRDGGDEFARLKGGFNVRCVAGQAIKVGNRDHAPHGRRGDRFDPGVQRPHRHGHVGRVDRDALITGPQHGVQAVETPDGGTARAGLAFVAGLGRVVKVITARALQQVAPGGGLVAQLP